MVTIVTAFTFFFKVPIMVLFLSFRSVVEIITRVVGS